MMPLPDVPYESMERRICKVSSDYHIRFDNAYYSVGREYLHKEVLVRASVATVKIYTRSSASGRELHREASGRPIPTICLRISRSFPSGTEPTSQRKP